MGGMNTVICKNDRCPEIVPEGRSTGRPKEYCTERCRRRYNARLYYKRATSGIPFAGLQSLTSMGYPFITRRKSQTTKEARKRLQEHGENCKKAGEWCPAKLHDAYNRKKLCLVRAVFTDDWLELMYAEEGKVHEREMTTPDGMWIDDYNEMMKKSGFDIESANDAQVREFKKEAMSTMRGTNRPIPEFPS